MATPATTCRGLYVAVTRGRDENLICVTTDTHDIADAIDVLQHVLATNRADHPATHTRRDLAATTPPRPPLNPRCEIPDWFWDLHHTAHNQLADAQAAVDDYNQQAAHTATRLATNGERLREASLLCEPHDRAIAAVHTELEHAQQRHRTAERDLADSGPLHRRGARAVVAATADDVTTAHTALEELTRRAQPLLDQRTAFRDERERLRDHLTRNLPLALSINRTDENLTQAQHLVAALDTWHHWATGKTIPPGHLANTASILNELDDQHIALAQPLTDWLDRHHPAPTRAAEPQHHRSRLEPRLEPPGIDIGL